MLNQKFLQLSFLFIVTILFQSCTNDGSTVQSDGQENQVRQDVVYTNKAHSLVGEMVEKVGDFKALYKKNDVSYLYTYKTPDGKQDISEEKYMFKGELSYGKYLLHERTLPDLKGVMEQSYDGTKYLLKHEDNFLDSEAIIKKVAFNRPTNFYWFTMMQKLLDPGLKYELEGEKTIEGKDYDIVKVTFPSVKDRPTDTYTLFINKATKLVDQFLFTVADYGVMEPKLMQVEYEEIDGLLMPTHRRYKNSDWNATISDEPWITVEWSNIQFNNGLSREFFSLN